MIVRTVLLLSVALFASVGSLAQPLSDAQLKAFAAQTEWRFAVVSNIGEDGPQARIRLHNRSDVALPEGTGDWRLYFHSVRRVSDTTVAGLHLTHVQGDLHRVAPTEDFPGLAPGESLELFYEPSSAMAAYTDFMPRAFIHRPGSEPAVFANTDTEDMSRFVEVFDREAQQRRSAQDQVPIATAERRYERNRATHSQRVSDQAVRQRIIPKPLSLETHWGSATLSPDWTIHYAGRLSSEADYLAEQLSTLFDAEFSRAADHESVSGPRISLRVASEDTDLPEQAESYRLEIDDDQIRITGRDNAGAFYGLQSLLKLLPATMDSDSVTLPNLTVLDAPRAGWRGMHYDMGRNFHGQAVTLRLIEQMGRYKLNKLHLHLTEDEGWRLEIPGLPELTEVGGERCFDPEETDCLLTQLGTGPHKSGSGNGYYTRDDFIEILEYAAARHIEVIPEIDMPGHARAAIKSMDARYRRLMAAEQPEAARQYLLSHPEDTSDYMTVQNYTDNSIDVCLDSSYAFVDKVMYELQQMYRDAGLKLNIFHMGGDEVGKGSWTGSPACRDLIAEREGIAGVADLKPYFVSRVAALAKKRGLALAGWEDGLMYDANNPFNRSQFDNDRVIANAWDNIWEWGVADRAYRLANAGYEVVLSHGTHLYFDHPYEAHPEERGYYWATRYTDTRKVFGYMPEHLYANADTTRNGAPIDNLEALVGRALPPLKQPDNILGIQGQVWTETIRTPEQLERMVYPRLLALAERAWHRAEWEGDSSSAEARAREFAVFARTLAERELPRLAESGVQAYLAPPGARWENGQLQVNTALPGLTVEVSTNGLDWQAFQAPVSAEQAPVMLRTRLDNNVSRSTRLD
ncbi:family 20 glycosylhydrolase [Marinimicrobium sp. LS-A18]|uniref:family 20 glycosylhydrolase n=1 Tax=Marinimicrobium sp. LS-A18 TaxID=1381596 RepID=UPI0004636F59|nr:family 20 glycosylhydrolase [Marinimicrobium sp. LS-A18]